MASEHVAGRRNLGVLTGALFVVLWIVGMVSLGSGAFPMPSDRMDKVQAYFKASGSGAGLNAGFQILSAVPLLWFTGTMAGFLRRHGRPGSAANLVLVGGAVAAATMLLSAAAMVSLTGSDVSSDAAATQALCARPGAAEVAERVRPRGRSGGHPRVADRRRAADRPVHPDRPFLGFLWMLIATIMINLRRLPVAATG